MITFLNATKPSPIDVVERHREIISSHWSDLLKLLSDPSLCEILRKKRDQDLLPDSLGFNLFSLIAEKYRYENFHSEIMAALLDPTQPHGAGHRHVHAFIQWLKTCTDKNLDGLSLKNFENVEVKREEGRIDILIYDKKSNKAIIFENKINGAWDMDRQLPRYLDNLERNKIEVVAIVYLTLNLIKDPDQTNWLPATEGKSSDCERIHKLLIQTVAFSHDSRSLLEWIHCCEKNTNQFDTLAAFRQYGLLIQHLGGHAMSNILTEKFYNEILKKEGGFEFWKNAESLVDILTKDLPRYRASRLRDDLGCKFKSFWDGQKDNNNYASFRGGDIVVSVECKENCSILQIWDSKFEVYNLQRVDGLVQSGFSIDLEFIRDEKNDSWRMSYKFPEEEESLWADFEKILTRLNGVVLKLPNSEEIHAGLSSVPSDG